MSRRSSPLSRAMRSNSEAKRYPGAKLLHRTRMSLRSCGLWLLRASLRSRSQQFASPDRRHSDLRPRLHPRQLLHVAHRPRDDVARAGEPGFIAFADGGAAEADGDGGALGPIGDLAGGDDGAGVLLARDPHRHVEIDLLAASSVSLPISKRIRGIIPVLCYRISDDSAASSL